MPFSAPYLETPRLVLRPFEEKDIGPSYQMNLDPEVSRFTGDGGVVSLEEMERRIKEDVWGDYQNHGYGRLVVEWKKNGQFIGFAGLKYLADMEEVDLGYRLMRNCWGKGIATEAAQASVKFGFEALQLTNIIAMTLPENAASIRVLSKLNFAFRETIWEDGLEICLYELTKESWQPTY